jgi:hypothetical protein
VSVDVAPQTRGGFSVIWDIIVAPQAAFAAIRERPRWLIAYVLTCVLGMIGAFLQIPAGEHVAAAAIAHQAAHDPNMAGMSPEKLRQTTDLVVGIQRWVWVFYPVITIIGITVAALIMLVGNAIVKGTATFGKLFALSANVSIVYYGIAYLIIGFLSTLHGAADFNAAGDLIKLLPSLAWVAPNAGPKLTVLLGAINPFQIWSLVLLALGLKSVAGIKTVPAYVVAAIVCFGGLLFSVPLAK